MLYQNEFLDNYVLDEDTIVIDTLKTRGKFVGELSYILHQNIINEFVRKNKNFCLFFLTNFFSNQQ